MSAPTVPLSTLLRVHQALNGAIGLSGQPEAELIRIGRELAEANGSLSFWLEQATKDVGLTVEAGQ